jgi:hypothetical protein
VGRVGARSTTSTKCGGNDRKGDRRCSLTRKPSNGSPRNFGIRRTRISAYLRCERGRFSMGWRLCEPLLGTGRIDGIDSEPSVAAVYPVGSSDRACPLGPLIGRVPACCWITSTKRRGNIMGCIGVQPEGAESCWAWDPRITGTANPCRQRAAIGRIYPEDMSARSFPSTAVPRG